jgi:hypothetical protein
MTVDNQPASAKKRREELREEYFKLIDILQSYDPYFLSIKNWGVTIIEVAAAIGITKKAPVVFLPISFIASGFWLTEVRFKLLQFGHLRRGTERERALNGEEQGSSSPG